MKKNILHLYILAVVLFAASAFTACSNNDEQASVLPVNTYTITVNATKGDDASSAPSNRALALDDTKLNATWAAGEQVTVYNVTKSTELTGNLTALSDGASTTLSGTLTGSVAVGDVLTLKFLSPDYASQTGTLDYIAANCDYATASVTVSSIDGNNITTSSASFTNQQAIVKFTLKDNAKVNDNDLSATQLVVTANGTSYTVTPTSATNVLYVAIPGFASKDVAFTATVGNDTYTYAKTGVTFENGKYYTINVKMALVKTLANATTDDIGKVVDTDGKLYNTAAEATSPAAMIAYISSKGHGLAIACADQSATQTFYGGALELARTAVVGGTWRMPSKEDWQNMFIGCGGSKTNDLTYNDAGFRAKLYALSTEYIKDISNDVWYWTSTAISESSAYGVTFSSSTATFQSLSRSEAKKVRAVLAF